MNLLYFFLAFIIMILLFGIRGRWTGFKERFSVNDYVLAIITGAVFVLCFTGQSAYAAAVSSLVFCAGLLFAADDKSENEFSIYPAIIIVSAQAGAAYHGNTGVMAALITMPAGIVSTVCFAVLAQNADKNVNNRLTKILIYLWPVFSVSIPAAGSSVIIAVISAVAYMIIFHYAKNKFVYSEQAAGIMFFVFSLQVLLIMVFKGVVNF